MWRLRVNGACIGTGSCVGISPAHFRLGPESRSHPVHECVAPDEKVLDAVASCPMEAIEVVDEDTGQAVNP